jgi:hypothetical protein
MTDSPELPTPDDDLGGPEDTIAGPGDAPYPDEEADEDTDA